MQTNLFVLRFLPEFNILPTGSIAANFLLIGKMTPQVIDTAVNLVSLAKMAQNHPYNAAFLIGIAIGIHSRNTWLFGKQKNKAIYKGEHAAPAPFRHLVP